MHVIGTGREAVNQAGEEPGETPAQGTAEPPGGDTLAEQLFDPLTLRRRDAPGERVCRKLAATRLTLMILLPMAGMTIFLVSVRSTGRTRISDDHGTC